MSTDSISPLRQRMIEDMSARKLCTGTQKHRTQRLGTIVGPPCFRPWPRWEARQNRVMHQEACGTEGWGRPRNS
jgi:hypothetical protein